MGVRPFDHSKIPWKWPLRALGVFAAIFVILAREGYAPEYFGSIGKSLFWTGLILYSLVLLNRDVMQYASAKVLFLVLVLVQVELEFVCWYKLSFVNFFVLAAVSVLQGALFSSPFMLIRRQHTGIWY